MFKVVVGVISVSTFAGSLALLRFRRAAEWDEAFIGAAIVTIVITAGMIAWRTSRKAIRSLEFGGDVEDSSSIGWSQHADLIAFASPFLATAMTIGIVLAADYSGDRRSAALVSLTMMLNAILAASGAAFGGMLTRGTAVSRVTTAFAWGIVGFVCYFVFLGIVGSAF